MDASLYCSRSQTSGAHRVSLVRRARLKEIVGRRHLMVVLAACTCGALFRSVPTVSMPSSLAPWASSIIAQCRWSGGTRTSLRQPRRALARRLLKGQGPTSEDALYSLVKGMPNWGGSHHRRQVGGGRSERQPGIGTDTEQNAPSGLETERVPTGHRWGSLQRLGIADRTTARYPRLCRREFVVKDAMERVQSAEARYRASHNGLTL